MFDQPMTTRKRATADEIQIDLKGRIDRLIARDAKFSGCQPPRPRLLPVRTDRDGPNWTVEGFPGLPPGCFGELVRIVDQARLEYELVA